MPRGIRILDEKYGAISVSLQDILVEVSDGNIYQWSILFFYGSGRLGNGKTIPAFEKEVNHLERGLFVDWEELKSLASRFDQIIDISVLGCKDKEKILRYQIDQDKYESCDFVIEMIDSGCWEIFSSDIDFINRLAKKFKDIEWLEPDFQNEWLSNNP